MPKVKKSKPKVSPVATMDPQAPDLNTEKKVALKYPVQGTDNSLAGKLAQYKKRNFTDLVKQVTSEYELAYLYMKPKIEEWALRLKLYNNQRRDKEAVGDPLMFTIHQTVLASLYSDRLASKFEGREEGDEDMADTLDVLALYDEDDMEKDIIDYEWDWDASFFGRGLMLFMEWDREALTPIPEVIDPMTWLRDSEARSVNGDRRGRGAMRNGGREIRLTKNEMRRAGIYFNFEDIKPDTKSANSLLDRGAQMRAEAQGLGDVSKRTAIGENQTFRLLEWFTILNDKKILVTLAENRTKVVRYTELTDAEDKSSNLWPIIDRPVYPMAHDWDGVSIPDLTEDKQRARSVMQNLGIKIAKTGLNPGYLYDTNKVKNKADLNVDFNKFVGIDGNPSGAIAEIPRSGIKAEVQWILDALDTASQRATATPEMQQGTPGSDKRTLGEVQIVASKVDTRYSLSAKVWGWSEKRFWQQWYRLYKKHFTDGIDEKSVRIAGAMGSQWRKLSRADIILSTDPDVKVESKIVSDDNRLQQLQMYRGFIKDVLAIAGAGANLRFAIKNLGKLSGQTKDQIDRILPPNVDEMTAEEENEALETDKLAMVEPTDDDMIHIEIHNKCTDTPAKYAHIKAHKKAMRLKKQHPELFPAVPAPIDGAAAANAMGDMPGATGPVGTPGGIQTKTAPGAPNGAPGPSGGPAPLPPKQ